jgi:hypothetical protein
VNWLTSPGPDSADDGAHRKAEANFNPGLARSLTAYCVNGLVLYSIHLLNFIHRSSQAGDLPWRAFAPEFAAPK